jgi:ribosomal protein S16
VKYWLSVGAQPSETVAGLLKRAGVTGGDAAPEAAVADAS